MEVEELRVGNLIYMDGDFVSIDLWFMKEAYIRNGVIKTMGAFPIPLTEELLLKCGFEAESKYCDLKLNGINISSSSLICKTLERRCFYLNLGENNENLNISIDYLHQLQNLYFALTNEKLKIEL